MTRARKRGKRDDTLYNFEEKRILVSRAPRDRKCMADIYPEELEYISERRLALTRHSTNQKKGIGVIEQDVSVNVTSNHAFLWFAFSISFCLHFRPALHLYQCLLSSPHSVPGVHWFINKLSFFPGNFYLRMFHPASMLPNSDTCSHLTLPPPTKLKGFCLQWPTLTPF